jgi:nitroimidazol reductase NimA-like FMN-containing flavoprotein (pyridoxamine 5'-phosphate oxidase superfamily)
MSASVYRPDPRSREVETLDVDECWRLLRLGSVGRLAFSGLDGGMDILPINYLTYERRLFFRTAPGGKLGKIQAHPEVAFELDGQDDRRRWSVVVHGTAEALLDPSEVEQSRVEWLISWSPTRKEHFVRIDPRDVSGRRFPRHYHAASLHEAPPGTGRPLVDEAGELSSQDGANPKPWPIPQRAPEKPLPCW